MVGKQRSINIAISVRHFSVHEIDDIFGRAKGGQ